jgi:hypothetical protein
LQETILLFVELLFVSVVWKHINTVVWTTVEFDVLVTTQKPAHQMHIRINNINVIAIMLMFLCIFNI